MVSADNTLSIWAGSLWRSTLNPPSHLILTPLDFRYRMQKHRGRNALLALVYKSGAHLFFFHTCEISQLSSTQLGLSQFAILISKLHRAKVRPAG